MSSLLLFSKAALPILLQASVPTLPTGNYVCAATTPDGYQSEFGFELIQNDDRRVISTDGRMSVFLKANVYTSRGAAESLAPNSETFDATRKRARYLVTLSYREDGIDWKSYKAGSNSGVLVSGRKPTLSAKCKSESDKS